MRVWFLKWGRFYSLLLLVCIHKKSDSALYMGQLLYVSLGNSNCDAVHPPWLFAPLTGSLLGFIVFFIVIKSTFQAEEVDEIGWEGEFSTLLEVLFVSVVDLFVLGDYQIWNDEGVTFESAFILQAYFLLLVEFVCEIKEFAWNCADVLHLTYHQYYYILATQNQRIQSQSYSHHTKNAILALQLHSNIIRKADSLILNLNSILW